MSLHLYYSSGIKKCRKPYLFLLLLVFSFFTASAQQDTVFRAGTKDTIKTIRKIDSPVPVSEKNEQFFFTGDAVEIRVFPDTSHFVNGIHNIDDNGYIELPVLGYMRVTELTIEELRNKLMKGYVEYLPQPNILVRPVVRVSVQGGFVHPGLYWVDPSESLWSVVKRAGGTKREDGLEMIMWRRNSQTVSESIISHIESGRSLSGIDFRSGDQLTVTDKPKMRGWEIFRTDILPVLGFAISSVASAATVYIAYETYKQGR